VSDLVERAAALAREAHASQRRKGDTQVPYFKHLESVAQRLRQHGIDDELTLAAAYLHDVLEDQPDHGDRVRREFPPEVVATVEVITERKLDDEGRPYDKEHRFRGYVDALEEDTPAAHRAAVVSCADKLDNVLDLVKHEREGRQLLLELSTRPGRHAHHLERLRRVYAPRVPAPLLAAFDAATRELLDYLTAWLPGRAVAIAAAAHQGQFDRAGRPYILHPLRLMMRAETPAQQMAAVLHDVVEDSSWTLARLVDEGFPPDVMQALDALTKREGESYDAFIDRVLACQLAVRVKLLDIEDNLNLTRLDTLSAKDLERVDKYHRARRRLLDATK
jgi:(p)ppGpp synthase/HD superfamily hydrolase